MGLMPSPQSSASPLRSLHINQSTRMSNPPPSMFNHCYSQFYYLMVMIVHGHISDMESTIEAIVAASEFPMSIIIIAVAEGDEAPGEFANLEILDADDKPLVDINGKKQTRDIVQFVPF